jgi:hypothetical protein
MGWDLKGRPPLPGNRTNSLNKLRLPPHQKRTTHASEEREVGEVTLLQETRLILRNTIAYLKRRINLRSGALQRLEGIELRDRHGVLDPSKKLLVRNDPNILLLLDPIQELIYHLDSAIGWANTRISGLYMTRSVEIKYFMNKDSSHKDEWDACKDRLAAGYRRNEQ